MKVYYFTLDGKMEDNDDVMEGRKVSFDGELEDLQHFDFKKLQVTL